MASLSASQIKFIRSLSQKKFRQESGLFIAEGEKIVNEALQSPFHVQAVYKMADIGEECMKRISNLSSPSPVLAVIEQKKEAGSEAYLTEILHRCNKQESSSKAPNPLFLALDGIKDPGNLGTIIRLADWFGIESLFVSEDTVELYNPKVVQATMGAIFRKPVIYCNLSDTLQLFNQAGLPVYGTFLNGENLYTARNLKKSGLIVMGSESFGISPELEKQIPHKLFIPPYPADAQTSESLNVATATAIICAEFRRS